MPDDLERLVAAIEGEDPSPDFVSALRTEIEAELLDDLRRYDIVLPVEIDDTRTLRQRQIVGRRLWIGGGVAAAIVAVVVGLWAATNDGDEELVASDLGATENAVNIVGIWRRTTSDPVYLQFLEDGTSNWAEGLETVTEGLGTQWNYRVEGTQLFVEETIGMCETVTGSYEVDLLESGHLRFVVIEDECRGRVTFLSGRPDDGITREFEPTP